MQLIAQIEDVAVDSYFEELKVWSEIKLRILEKYLRGYLRIRGGTNPIVYYVDGFAGAGRYGHGVDAKDGSPLRIAKLAKELAAAGNCDLRCINVERQNGNVAALMNVLSSYPQAEVLAGTFAEQLPAILSKIGQAPAVAFLDPFGVKPVVMSDIRPVVRRPDTELLLNLNTRGLKRLAGFANSLAKDAPAKRQLLTDVFGDTAVNPQWLQAWVKLGGGVEWERWAVDSYMEAVGRENGNLKYRVAYPVRESPKATPKYYLVFATRARQAIELMNDLVCTEEEDLISRSDPLLSGPQASFFGMVAEVDEAERQQRISALIEGIHAYGRSHQRSSRADVWWHFMRQGCFGEFKKKHYREALDKLADAGRARYEGRPNDQTAITFL